jgi:hypothetical protein
MTIRPVFPLAFTLSLAACSMTTAFAPAGQSSDTSVPITLTTELNATPVLAKPPMVDTARVAGTGTFVAVVGLLNQTAPCFGIASAATRQGTHVRLRLTAQQIEGTCATLAAGAYDYDVAVKGLAPGTYDVDVMHRILFNDGRVAESKVGSRRVEVR